MDFEMIMMNYIGKITIAFRNLFDVVCFRYEVVTLELPNVYHGRKQIVAFEVVYCEES